MDELLGEFLIESHEHLARFEVDLVALERSPTDSELLASAYRALHTIKGNCGFLGLPRLEKVMHASETLLSRLRDGETRFTADIATLLLRAVDAIRTQLDTIEQDGTVRSASVETGWLNPGLGGPAPIRWNALMHGRPGPAKRHSN